MRSILQRVRRSTVMVGDDLVGSIGIGALVLVGVEVGDDEETVLRTADKLVSLRIFADGDGKMNLSAGEIGASFLIVSQFTLAASLARGRRPSFDKAAPASLAEPLVERLARCVESKGLHVEQGRFGATMQVELVNDGPVTFVLDT